ncbi:hypothetical protein [Castellaniella sp.]|nr:hypothetical protein [Castellaniella sp.]
MRLILSLLFFIVSFSLAVIFLPFVIPNVIMAHLKSSKGSSRRRRRRR